jgi:hypothetical protein
MLDTASLSTLTYENSLSQPATWFWNDTHHVVPANQEECSPAREQEPLAINEVTR